ncbi:MAG: class I SAM-dependent methyltransferase [Brevinematales bacterium]|nr:class I SAM-dependent methyltransferase [Brevinematales bacterium]
MKASSSPRCMICDSPLASPIMTAYNTHGRHVLSRETFPVFFCEGCGTYQINIKQDEEYYTKYYNSLDYYNQENRSRILSFLSTIFSKISFWLKMHSLPLKKHGFFRWLDVGAGDGSFLQKLSPKRFQPFGVEISQIGYEEIKKKHIPCFHGDFLSLDFGQTSFDIISFWHVLEHCCSPKKYLKKACELLGEGGVLIVALPWAESLGFAIGKKGWFHLDSPRHVFWPTKKTMEVLIQDLPLSQVKGFSSWWEYPLDLWWSLKEVPFFFKWFLRLLYPIVKIGDRETMIFVFKKTTSNKGGSNG